jgi:hypothetical protein
MIFSPISLCILVIVFGFNYACAEDIKSTYLDRNNNVHILAKNGKHRQVTRQGNASMLKLAPNNKAVAWLALNKWTANGDDKPGAEELIIYRDGKIFSIKCSPFIRDYWFGGNGNQIAIDCGGRRFAGRQILYDTNTLREIAKFDQAEVPREKRPAWSDNDS